MQQSLKHYQLSAKLLAQAIKEAEQSKSLGDMVEIQNLLVFISIEIDGIEQDIENQM